MESREKIKKIYRPSWIILLTRDKGAAQKQDAKDSGILHREKRQANEQKSRARQRFSGFIDGVVDLGRWPCKDYNLKQQCYNIGSKR